LVDTGASEVTVTEKFASNANLTGGISTTFKTANGDMPGRIIKAVPVRVGNVEISGVTVAIGLVGFNQNQALLGQSFLSKFDVMLQKDQMILRAR
jgi:aspartyl protease family protein